MNLAAFSIDRRVITLVLTFAVLVGGVKAFQGMSRLEDPEFTIKDALVVTPYPGASAVEVEQEVTDKLELAIQQLGQIKRITSRSERGLSTITVTIKDKYGRAALPQVWDELRRKVGDSQKELPPGAGPSQVVDDYGDVYGVFVVVYGKEYDYAELKRVVDLLRRELVLVHDVARVETFGERTEAIYIEPDRDRMAELGIPESVIVNEVQNKNVVVDAGHVHVGQEFIALSPTGELRDVEQFESILLTGEGDQQIFLRDVAKVRRGYVEPQDYLIRYDGKPGIGLGISTVSGGNVVNMGVALSARIHELLDEIPLGIQIGIVSMQSDAVRTAIAGFVNSLLQAVVIVVVVLLFFMGMRSGLLIGFILLLTIVGSFIVLAPMGVALERISLGALIIALGMLVDNAIVVVDGILIRTQRGEKGREAAAAVVAQSGIPLLGATVIAILAFAAIGTSQDNTGEFCRSLFQVVMVSLLFSWVTAVTVTPLLGTMFLKPSSASADADPYGGRFYAVYKGFLRGCVRRRWLTLAIVFGLFLISLVGFRFVDQSFFPPSTRPQLMVDVWLPQGTYIDTTKQTVSEIEDYVLSLEGVTHTTSLIGKGALRFLLTYTPEKLNSSYAQLLVDVDDSSRIGPLLDEIELHLTDNYPDVQAYAMRFQLGPGSNGKIQARFSGPDANELRVLASQAEEILYADPNTKGIRNNWRQRVKVIRPEIAEEQANLNGIQRSDIAHTLDRGFQGRMVGSYREQDLSIPIVLRAPEAEQRDVASLQNLQIWSPAAKRAIPLRQVISRIDTGFEDAIIERRNRLRTITVYADPIKGSPSVVFARVRPKIEGLSLPTGYRLEWGGEYEDSNNARNGLMRGIPAFIAIMALTTVALFNSLRQPLIIWLCVPLALIGVTGGLLATGQPFGFMALLGFLSLSGMLIKNAIVLIDEINSQRSEGKQLTSAIVDSAVSRLRPVAMAAATTALGMIPLLFDAFFVSMAVTIIAGLVFATILTMIVVPVLFAVFYRAPDPA